MSIKPEMFLQNIVELAKRDCVAVVPVRLSSNLVKGSHCLLEQETTLNGSNLTPLPH